VFFSDVKIPDSYYLVDTPRDFSWLKQLLLSQDEFAFDIEANSPTTKSKKLQAQWGAEALPKVCGISFSWNRKVVEHPWSPGYAAYIPLSRTDDTDYWGSRQDKIWEGLSDILTSSIPKTAFNNKYDVSTLFKILGIRTQECVYDPMLMKALLDEEKLVSFFSLKSNYSDAGDITKLGCSDAYLDIDGSAFKRDLDETLKYYDPKYKRYSKVPLKVIYPYGCADSDLALSLKMVFKHMLEEEGMWWLFEQLIMPLSHVIMRGELHGAPLDLFRAAEVRDCQKATMEDSEWWFKELSGLEVNIGSDKQLGDALFNQMGLRGTRTDKGNWKTDVDTLRGLDHPVVAPLVRFAKAKAIHNNYAVASLSRVKEVSHGGATGWVHADFQIYSKTGRLRCFDPNLATLPRTENGGDIVKSMWACPDGYRFIFKDFSQVEMRVASHLSQEPVWLDAFNQGKDMHAATAHKVFGLDCAIEDVKKFYPEKRSAAKAVNFGIIYGESVWGLAENLKISVEEAQQIIDDYFASAQVLKQYIDNVHSKVEWEGQVVNIFGRVRHLPDATVPLLSPLKWPENTPKCYRRGPTIKWLGVDLDDMYDLSGDQMKDQIRIHEGGAFSYCLNCKYVKSCVVNREVKYVKSKVNGAKRQAVNAPIQSTAVDMCSFCMIWSAHEFDRQGLDATPILHLHDEIGVYCKDEHVESAERIMEYYMTEYLRQFTNFSVPLLTDTEIVQRWSDKGKH